MENNKLDKRTKWSYCIGATGRDVLQFKEHHYTMFNPEIDFAKIFEIHTPLKIEY